MLPVRAAAAFSPALPFAVWLFLAIEQLPLAAEESVDPKRDMPQGIILGMFTLIVSALHDRAAQRDRCAERRARLVLARHVGRAAARRLPRHLSATASAKIAGACCGDRPDRELPHDHLRLRAADLFAVARGLFPAGPVDHPRRHKTPHMALIAGALVGLADHADRLVRRWARETGRRDHRRHAAQHGGVRRDVLLHRSRRCRSSCCAGTCRTSSGRIAARSASRARSLTIIIALVTLYYQLSDPVYRVGVIGVASWFAVGIVYFALFGRQPLILSPEEEFAMEHRERS